MHRSYNSHWAPRQGGPRARMEVSGMRPAWRLAAVVALALATTVPWPALAQQGDMAARLVGRWEGRLDPPPPPSPSPRHPPPLRRERPEEAAPYALVIDAVTPRDGGWTGRGTFGRTEGKRSPVTVTITEGPEGPRLEFGHGRGAVTRLTLRGEGFLSGTLGQRGERQERHLTLRRVP